jgi:hypothetical protein
MPFPRIIYYLDTRLHEWLLSGSLTSIGLAMMIWPRMAEGSIFDVVERVLRSIFGGNANTVLALLLFTIGGLGMAALIANGGSLWIGPRIRSVAACARSILWASVVISMERVSEQQGFPSPMVFFFSLFTAGEVYISYRAVLDVRSTQ